MLPEELPDRRRTLKSVRHGSDAVFHWHEHEDRNPAPFLRSALASVQEMTMKIRNGPERIRAMGRRPFDAQVLLLRPLLSLPG